jgi:hypothetical protein
MIVDGGSSNSKPTQGEALASIERATFALGALVRTQRSLVWLFLFRLA